MRKLKVFRTPTGFHDAYVAAPSRKAALEAWGSDADLFARGIAEEITDETLSREPLENPGKVIRRLRGSAAEQLAALSPDPAASWSGEKGGQGKSRSVPQRKKSTGSQRLAKEEASEPRTRAKAKPRPTRDKLHAVERALADIVERQARDTAEMRDRQRALDKERRTLETAQERERRTAERAVEAEKQAHADRLDRWIADNA